MLSRGKPTIAHHVRPLLFRECPVYDLTCRCQLYDLGCRLLLREDKEQVDSTDLTPQSPALEVSSATRPDEFPKTHRLLGPVSRSYPSYLQTGIANRPSEKGAALRKRGDKLRSVLIFLPFSARTTLHPDRTHRLRIFKIRRKVYGRCTESIISTE